MEGWRVWRVKMDFPSNFFYFFIFFIKGVGKEPSPTNLPPPKVA